MSAKTVLLNRKLENLRTQYQKNIKSMDEMRSEYEKSLTDRLAAMQNELKKKQNNGCASMKNTLRSIQLHLIKN